ncbi:MAG: cell division protein FtsL [Thermoleophilia bacterium]|nr:cell division protein FtsL [Thermoleophilia bacterium]
MSDVRTPDDIATSNDADHDPWWGDLDPQRVAERVTTVTGDAPITPRAPARRPVRAPRSTGGGKSFGARVATEISRSARNNHRFRRIMVATVITLIVIFGLSCSVGVIMLNNLVIRRSAELDSLDTSRKKFRTDNAKLSADNARLSSPPRVTALARKRLGMIPAMKMAQFIFLDQDNSPAAPVRNRRRRLLLQRERAAEAARVNATTARYQEATGSTSTPTTPPATGANSSSNTPLGSNETGATP